MAEKELFGKVAAGERYRAGSGYERVVRVLSQDYWSPDRIEDEDEFGREPGWYTWAEVEAAEPTAEEVTCDAAEAAERARKAEAARAEANAYRESLGRMAVLKAALVAEGGLVPATHGRPPKSEDQAEESLGYACQPGRGVSCSTELIACRDEGGQLRWIAYGCPVDGGLSYWVRPEILTGQADRARIWKYNPPPPGLNPYPDSYPGPGIPEAELTEAERVEVAGLRAARREALRADQWRSAQIGVTSWLTDRGLIEGERSPYTSVPVAGFRLDSWEIVDLEGLESRLDYLGQHKETGSSYSYKPPAVVVRVRVVPPAAAFDRKPRSRKPAPAESLPATDRLNNFTSLAVEVVRP